MNRRKIAFVVLVLAFWTGTAMLAATLHQSNKPEPIQPQHKLLLVDPLDAMKQQHESNTLQADFDKLQAEHADLIGKYKALAAELESEKQLYKAAAAEAARQAAEATKKASSNRAESVRNEAQSTESPFENAQTFVASHYTARCDGCTGKTATGLDVRNTIYTADGLRVVAVDPSVIPLGSVLDITYPNGTTIRARAADTGGSIKGNKLDVLVASRDEAYRIGRPTVQVKIVSN